MGTVFPGAVFSGVVVGVCVFRVWFTVGSGIQLRVEGARTGLPLIAGARTDADRVLGPGFRGLMARWRTTFEIYKGL